MDEIVICKSCLQFMGENNKLKKQLREKDSEIKALKKEIIALDLTPCCQTCSSRMSKEYHKDRVDPYRVKRFNSWVCEPCLKDERRRKVEDNLEFM